MPCTKITVTFKPHGIPYEYRQRIAAVLRSGQPLLSHVYEFLADASERVLNYGNCCVTITTLHSGKVLKIYGESVRSGFDDYDYVYRAKYWNGSAVVIAAQNAPPEGELSEDPQAYRPASAPKLKGVYDVYAEGETVTWSGYFWSVDATDDVRAEAEAWQEEQYRLGAIARCAKAIHKAVTEAIENERSVTADKDAVVVKGRKVKVGTVVRVTYVNQYGQYGPSAKVIGPKGDTIWVSLENLKAIPRFEEGTFTRLCSASHGFNLPTNALGLLVAYAKAETVEDRNFAWGVFCDAIGDVDATGDNAYVGEEVATVLREIGTEKTESV